MSKHVRSRYPSCVRIEYLILEGLEEAGSERPVALINTIPVDAVDSRLPARADSKEAFIETLRVMALEERIGFAEPYSTPPWRRLDDAQTALLFDFLERMTWDESAKAWTAPERAIDDWEVVKGAR
jgi:hypothetical protein